MGTHKYSINIATAWVTIVLRHMPGALGNHSHWEAGFRPVPHKQTRYQEKNNKEKQKILTML